MTVKMVREKLDNISYDLEGSIGDAIATLKSKEKIWKDKGYKDIRLDIDYTEDSRSIAIYGERQETLREAAARADAVERAARYKEEQERETYERLHAKFAVPQKKISKKKVKS